MNLNFDIKFDVFKFHEIGFNVGLLPNDVVQEAKSIIKNTKFKNFVEVNEKKKIEDINLNNQFPVAASWSQMPYDTLTTIMSPNNSTELKEIFTINDFPYEERLRELYCFNNAPLEVKNLANKVITMDFFKPLRESFVREQHKNTSWLRTIKSFTYGLWNGTEDLPWHNDTDDCCNMMLLIYFNDYNEWKPEWNGQICFGKEQEDGSVKEIHQHYPTDGTFVCINNYNPLMKHKTIANNHTKNRYTFNFKFKFE